MPANEKMPVHAMMIRQGTISACEEASPPPEPAGTAVLGQAVKRDFHDQEACEVAVQI